MANGEREIVALANVDVYRGTRRAPATDMWPTDVTAVVLPAAAIRNHCNVQTMFAAVPAKLNAPAEIRSDWIFDRLFICNNHWQQRSIHKN